MVIVLAGRMVIVLADRLDRQWRVSKKLSMNVANPHVLYPK